MEKSIKKNYIYNVSYQIVNLLMPLIVTPHVSRVLGVEGIGKYSYLSSIISYFTLFAMMGTSTYGQRAISYVQENRKRRSYVFWETELLSCCSSLISLLAYLVFALNQKNKIHYIIFAINILAVATDITWFFQGIEEFGKIVLRNLFFKVINITYVFIFIKTEENLLEYIFGMVVINFLSNASLWIYLPHYIDKVKIKSLKPFFKIKEVISLFLPTIAVQIYTVLDKTMIGIFTINSVENGYYESATKIVRIVMTIITSLGAVMLPRIGHLFELNEIEKIKNYMYRSYRFVGFLGLPLCLGLIGISDNLVPWFFGTDFNKAALLIKILSILIIIIGTSNVTGMQYFLPTKRQNWLTVSVLCGACINLIFNLILIPQCYSVGAAISSVIAESTVTICQLVLVRKEFSIAKIFWNNIKYFFSGFIMLVILRIENCYFDSSIYATTVMVISGAVSYFLCLLIFKDEFMEIILLDNLKKIKQKLKECRN